MPFSSGTFTPQYNWSNEAAAGNPIDPTKFTAEENDIATGLSTCILKDGTQTITADIPWNGKKITSLGTATAGGDALSQAAGDARYGQISSGSFTGTLTGMSGTVQAGFVWVKTVNSTGSGIVMLSAQTGTTGTSNATTFTITGLPSAIQNANVAPLIQPFLATDASGTTLADATILAGTMTLRKWSSTTALSTTGWTNSGLKGLPSGWTVFYQLAP